MIKWLYIILIVILSVLAFFIIHDAIMPFILAAIFSYLIYPVVKFCSHKSGISKNIIIAVAVMLFMSICITILFLVTPLIYEQAQMLVSKIKIYKQYVQDNIPMILDKANHINSDLSRKIQDAFQGYANNTITVAVSIVNNLWGYTVATLNIVLLFFLVPLISFYMLKDWQSGVLPFEKLLPLNVRLIVKRVVEEIDQLLSAYIRGQLNICCILSTYYSAGMWLIGCDFSILLGIITGFAIIIPFVGFLVSFCIALLLCYISFGLSINIAYLSVLYICGSILEGSILTPKIIGDKMGIHPLWIIFAILLFSQFFGIIGMICAIPLVGIGKILINLILEHYTTTVKLK